MEIFQFVEHSFDFDLINKCKTQLGSKSIKNINENLREVVQLDIPINNFKITINKEKSDKNIKYPFELSINNNQIFNYEKENSATEAENSEEKLSDIFRLK